MKFSHLSSFLATIALCGALSLTSALSTAQGGDAAAGRVKAVSCATCHQADGNSLSAAFPKLAGQNEKYLLRQLRAIQSGAYPVPVMAGQLDGLGDGDLRDLSAWFASQTMSAGVARREQLELGERIYRAGLASKSVPACSACHSPHGAGNAPAGFPRIAGQHADYIVARLKDYREKRRIHDETAEVMAGVVEFLSEQEMEAVANYVQGLR